MEPVADPAATIIYDGPMTKPRKTAEVAMHRLLETHPELQELAKKLLRQQARLKKAIGVEHFRLYLDIEKTANERCFKLVEGVWKAALALGHREERRQAKRAAAPKGKPAKG
jgi:hypothetical protein